MIAVAITMALAVGLIAGSLLTRKADRHQLQRSRRLGLIEGRQEQSRLVAHLQSRVAHLEAACRRMTTRTGDA